jgi:hypothetical protein
MILALVIVDWVFLFAILSLPVVQGFGHGRLTCSAVYVTWLLLTIEAVVFCAFGNSLPKDQLHRWRNQFPDGTHILAGLLGGWFAGVIMSVIGVGLRRVANGENLFQDPRASLK